MNLSTDMKVRVVRLRVPEDGPEGVAKKVEKALDEYEGDEGKRENEALQFCVEVSPNAARMGIADARRLKRAVEPFRARVKRSCPGHVVRVPNRGFMAAARTALFFFRPDVPTKVEIF